MCKSNVICVRLSVFLQLVASDGGPWCCRCYRSSVSKSAAKAAGSSSPVAAASPVKSAPVSSADSSASCSNTAVDHSTTDKSVNSASTADTAPAAGALDNGSVVCQTTNWWSRLLLWLCSFSESFHLVLGIFCPGQLGSDIMKNKVGIGFIIIRVKYVITFW